MSATIERLPTRPKPRLVDDHPGLVPVGAYVPAVVAEVAAAANVHPNVQRMHDAVDRWIKEARDRGGQGGVDYLADCLARVALNKQNLADWACNRAELRTGLTGVTIDDLESAQWRLEKAAIRLGGDA